MAKSTTPVIDLGEFAAHPLMLRNTLTEHFTASRSVKATEATAELLRAHVKTELMRGDRTLTDAARGITATIVEVPESETVRVNPVTLRALLPASEVARFTETTYTLEAVGIDGKRLPKHTPRPIDGRLSLGAVAREAKQWSDAKTYVEGLRDVARTGVISQLRTAGLVPTESTVYIFTPNTGALGGLRITVGTALDIDTVREFHPRQVALATETSHRGAHLRLDIRRITAAAPAEVTA